MNNDYQNEILADVDVVLTMLEFFDKDYLVTELRGRKLILSRTKKYIFVKFDGFSTMKFDSSLPTNDLCLRITDGLILSKSSQKFLYRKIFEESLTDNEMKYLLDNMPPRFFEIVQIMLPIYREYIEATWPDEMACCLMHYEKNNFTDEQIWNMTHATILW